MGAAWALPLHPKSPPARPVSNICLLFPKPLQLLLAVCEKSTPIGTSCQGAMLPSITNVINLADSHDRAAFAMVTHVKQEPRERENSESKEEVTLWVGWHLLVIAKFPSLLKNFV